MLAFLFLYRLLRLKGIIKRWTWAKLWVAKTLHVEMKWKWIMLEEQFLERCLVGHKWKLNNIWEQSSAAQFLIKPMVHMMFYII